MVANWSLLALFRLNLVQAAAPLGMDVVAGVLEASWANETDRASASPAPATAIPAVTCRLVSVVPKRCAMAGTACSFRVQMDRYRQLGNPELEVPARYDGTELRIWSAFAQCAWWSLDVFRCDMLTGLGNHSKGRIRRCRFVSPSPGSC